MRGGTANVAVKWPRSALLSMQYFLLNTNALFADVGFVPMTRLLARSIISIEPVYICIFYSTLNRKT